MDALEKYEYWIDIAKYDLDTAEAMYSVGKWLYVNDDVPRVHNIRHVIDRFSDKLPDAVTDEQYRLFDRLTAFYFYMEGRYPEYRQKLSELLDEREAKELLKQTEEVFAWLQTCKP